MKTRSKVLLGISVSAGIAGLIAFWGFILTRLGAKLDSSQVIANLFHVGNRWQWDASLGLFGAALVFVATYDRWGEPDDSPCPIVFSTLGALVGFIAAVIARGQQTNGLLGWKGLVGLFLFTGLVAFVAFAKDNAIIAAIFLLGLAFGIAFYVGAAAGACVTLVMALAFFAGLILHTRLLVRRLPTNPDHRF